MNFRLQRRRPFVAAGNFGSYRAMLLKNHELPPRSCVLIQPDLGDWGATDDGGTSVSPAWVREFTVMFVAVLN
jgi:hypothetical protein